MPPDCVLVYTIGMPFHDKSDGMDFSVLFSSSDSETILTRDSIIPKDGEEWQERRISLREIAGLHGSLIFAADARPPPRPVGRRPAGPKL